MADTDPTQTGGQEEKTYNTPRMDARLALEEGIAAKVQEADKPDTVALDVDDNGDLQYARDDKGRFAPKEEAAEPAEKPEPVEAAPEPEPVAEPRKVKVKVYGQEEEVDADTLIEHGIRNYQKDRAADIKLQEAARKLRQIEEYEQRVMRGQPPQGAEPQPQSTTQQGVQRAETDEERIERVVYNRETQKARAAFDKEFPEIAADPYLMGMAAQLEQERLATVAALGEPMGDPFEAYRSHGESVRKWIKKFQPAQVMSEDKAERKRTINAVPSTNAKAPAPAPEKVQTTSEIIAEMAAQRKAGRQLPQRRSQ